MTVTFAIMVPITDLHVLKCSRCDVPLKPADIVITFDAGDTIHVRCWRVNDSPDRRLEPRARIRRAQELIENQQGRNGQS
jgi:hypothetical protein